MEGIAVLLVIGIGILIFFASMSLDGNRVDKHIRSRGGKLTNKKWNPFGKGWFGEKDSRIYEIEYIDADGNRHQATCKTSLLSSVYMTDDYIVDHAIPIDARNHHHEDTYPINEDETIESSTSGIDELIAENLALREEIRRLREK